MSDIVYRPRNALRGSVVGDRRSKRLVLISNELRHRQTSFEFQHLYPPYSSPAANVSPRREGVAEDRVVGCDEQEHQVREEGERPAERASEDGMAAGHSEPVPRRGTPAGARGTLPLKKTHWKLLASQTYTGIQSECCQKV